MQLCKVLSHLDCIINENYSGIKVIEKRKFLRFLTMNAQSSRVHSCSFSSALTSSSCLFKLN